MNNNMNFDGYGYPDMNLINNIYLGNNPATCVSITIIDKAIIIHIIEK